MLLPGKGLLLLLRRLVVVAEVGAVGLCLGAAGAARRSWLTNLVLLAAACVGALRAARGLGAAAATDARLSRLALDDQVGSARVLSAV